MNEKFCIVMRYNSIYANFAEKLLDDSGMSDFIFNNTVSFISPTKKKNSATKLRPIKNIGLILTGDKLQLEKFENEFKLLMNKNPDLTDKIKYFITQIYKEA